MGSKTLLFLSALIVNPHMELMRTLQKSRFWWVKVGCWLQGFRGACRETLLTVAGLGVGFASKTFDVLRLGSLLVRILRPASLYSE